MAASRESLNHLTGPALPPKPSIIPTHGIFIEKKNIIKRFYNFYCCLLDEVCNILKSRYGFLNYLQDCNQFWKHFFALSWAHFFCLIFSLILSNFPLTRGTETKKTVQFCKTSKLNKTWILPNCQVPNGFFCIHTICKFYHSRVNVLQNCPSFFCLRSSQEMKNLREREKIFNRLAGFGNFFKKSLYKSNFSHIFVITLSWSHRKCWKDFLWYFFNL